MAFDDIAADLGGMAGGERIRHAEPRLDRLHVGGLNNGRGEAITVQVLDPAGAATAVGIMPIIPPGPIGESRPIIPGPIMPQPGPRCWACPEDPTTTSPVARMADKRSEFRVMRGTSICAAAWSDVRGRPGLFFGQIQLTNVSFAANGLHLIDQDQ